MFRTTDNNCGVEVHDDFIPNFNLIANQSIGSLISEHNQGLLVFPNDLSQTPDNISDDSIFTLQGKTLTTGNIMGFVGVNESQITIQSRFEVNESDYFLHYMLKKVFSINLFDLEHGMNNESIFDFLLYLFPFYLKKALRQGLYKEYHTREKNDSNVKGNINFNNHINRNIPFTGNVAYRVREHSYDNNLTQLVRHTIEYIRKHKFAQGILNLDAETQSCINEIVRVTPKYEYRDRLAILNKNLKPFNHPYFFEYKDLKRICLQILRFEGLKYGDEKNKIYGLLFDGAWLWEEYLYTFLKACDFHHPKNKSSEGAIYLFSGSKGKRYPDFWKDNFVLDAKYKRLTTGKVDRNDLHQIISYMYIKKAQMGGFIVPAANDTFLAKHKSIGQLNGYGGNLNVWTLAIPQQNKSFSDFSLQMQENENRMVEIIREFERIQNG